jgi:glycine/D-amino acid oxidase-like deaminating enzyme
MQQSPASRPQSTDPYWWVAAPREERSGEPVPPAADVAIVGAGYAGLSAACVLARAGRSVVVLDAEAPGFGGSSRSGGMVGHGHRLSYAALKARYGQAKAVALIKEGSASLDFVAGLIEQEGIDARFKRVGRFRGALKAADYDTLGREADLLRREAGVAVEVIPKTEQHREIVTPAYHGGQLFPEHGGLHPALFHQGLLAVVRKAGVPVIGFTPVEHISSDSDGKLVRTARGSVRARDVIVATNGYTGKATLGLARRLVAMPSYLIATEPLGQNRVQSLVPNLRMLVETGDRHLYYRPSPDGTRILLGGRAALHPIPLERAAGILARRLASVFPDLAGVGIAHAWTGNIAFTRSDLPAIGARGGLWYALGCNGSGVALMPYLGRKLALRVLGDPEGATAYDDIPFKAVPLYDGTPWFRPLLSYYYRAKERLAGHA